MIDLPVNDSAREDLEVIELPVPNQGVVARFVSDNDKSFSRAAHRGRIMVQVVPVVRVTDVRVTLTPVSMETQGCELSMLNEGELLVFVYDSSEISDGLYEFVAKGRTELGETTSSALFNVLIDNSAPTNVRILKAGIERGCDSVTESKQGVSRLEVVAEDNFGLDHAALYEVDSDGSEILLAHSSSFSQGVCVLECVVTLSRRADRRLFVRVYDLAGNHSDSELISNLGEGNSPVSL